MLEYWNVGILRFENWDVGSLEKFLLTCEGEYQEMEILFFYQHSIFLRARFTPLSPRKRVPSFHHSIIPCARHKLMPRKNSYILNKLYNFQNVQLVRHTKP